MKVVVVTKSVEETEALGAALGRVVRAGDVVALHGELGAGKTALVRGMARGMGLDAGGVSSPTFVVAHRYEHAAPVGGRSSTVLWHVDAYRLAGEDELESIGWDRVMDGSGVVAVEWAERIAGALPGGEGRADVTLEAAGESSRRVVIEAPESWAQRGGWAAVAAAGRGRHKQGGPVCPVCGEPVDPASPLFPFSSERCRMADLNKWLSGGYTVSRELMPEDADDPDLAP